MQFKPFEPDIEVSGTSLGAIIDGFRLFPNIALGILSKHKITRSPAPGQPPVIDREAWFPLDTWLMVWETISREVGGYSLFSIGQKIPENAIFPPHVNDLESGLKSIDIAYHMNHKKKGQVMFNPETGEMLEGIGHYHFRRTPGERRITMVCENPYPCEFDRGIISAMAARFEPRAKTLHDNGAPCRKKGADSCTYIVIW